MRLTLIVAASVLGCHAQPPPAMPHDEAWIEIADPSFAKKHSNVTKHTALPFDFVREGLSGTQLLLQFLDQAEAKGAKYASNIAIVLQMEHAGGTIECVTKVVPEGSEPKPAEVKSDDPPEDGVGTTTIRPWAPDVVTADVDDHDYRCEAHAARVNVTYDVPDPLENTYEADQKRYLYLHAPASPHVITTDFADTCTLVTNHRRVRRYEHFVAAHFQPPDWEKLAKVFSDKKLVELPPECHTIAAHGHRVQRVEADLSYAGLGPRLEPKLQPRRYDLNFGHRVPP